MSTPLPELPEPDEIQTAGAHIFRSHSTACLRAYGLAVWKAAMEQAAEAVPTNWCDSLLTGKEGIGQPPYHCPEIEKLLTNLRAAIRSLPLPESDMTQARTEK